MNRERTGYRSKSPVRRASCETGFLSHPCNTNSFPTTLEAGRTHANKIKFDRFSIRGREQAREGSPANLAQRAGRFLVRLHWTPRRQLITGIFTLNEEQLTNVWECISQSERRRFRIAISPKPPSDSSKPVVGSGAGMTSSSKLRSSRPMLPAFPVPETVTSKTVVP